MERKNISFCGKKFNCTEFLDGFFPLIAQITFSIHWMLYKVYNLIIDAAYVLKPSEKREEKKQIEGNICSSDELHHYTIYWEAVHPIGK